MSFLDQNRFVSFFKGFLVTGKQPLKPKVTVEYPEHKRPKPERAHGLVRVINERAREGRLSHLSRFDDLTGEMNRRHFTDVLAGVLQDAIRVRASFARQSSPVARICWHEWSCPAPLSEHLAWLAPNVEEDAPAAPLGMPLAPGWPDARRGGAEGESVRRVVAMPPVRIE